jgi:hypothetical protein
VCSSDALRKWKNKISSSDAQSNFASKLKENAAETYEKLKWAYGEHALSRARIFRWHKEFLDAHECG